MACTVIWEANGVQFVFRHQFSSEDVLRSNDEFASDSRSSSVKYALYNLMDVQEFTIETEAIRRVARMDARLYKTNPDMKFAVVATDLVMTGLTNMYKAYHSYAADGDTWDTELFTSIEGARSWIGPSAAVD